MSKELLCPMCHSVITKSTKFCPECGTKVQIINEKKIVLDEVEIGESTDEYEDDYYEDEEQENTIPSEDEEYSDEEEYEEDPDETVDAYDEDQDENENYDDDELAENDEADELDEYDDEDDEDDEYVESKPKSSRATINNPVRNQHIPQPKPKQTIERSSYDPNHDHYYDDVLPDIMDEINKFPTEVILKISIGIVAVASVIVYCIYYLRV